MIMKQPKLPFPTHDSSNHISHPVLGPRTIIVDKFMTWSTRRRSDYSGIRQHCIGAYSSNLLTPTYTVRVLLNPFPPHSSSSSSAKKLLFVRRSAFDRRFVHSSSLLLRRPRRSGTALDVISAEPVISMSSSPDCIVASSSSRNNGFSLIPTAASSSSSFSSPSPTCGGVRICWGVCVSSGGISRLA